MRVERIPTLRDNYTYLVIDPASNEAAVIDAPEAGPVIARVEALGVRVTKVLSTHHHRPQRRESRAGFALPGSGDRTRFGLRAHSRLHLGRERG
jgi:hypothetical protein